jgi:hypothetical protein
MDHRPSCPQGWDDATCAAHVCPTCCADAPGILCIALLQDATLTLDLDPDVLEEDTP